MIQEVIFGALFFVCAIIGYLVFNHFSNVRRIEFYRAQGVNAPPGYDNILLGHALEYAKHDEVVASLIGTDKPAIPHPMAYFLN